MTRQPSARVIADELSPSSMTSLERSGLSQFSDLQSETVMSPPSDPNEPWPKEFVAPQMPLLPCLLTPFKLVDHHEAKLITDRLFDQVRFEIILFLEISFTEKRNMCNPWKQLLKCSSDSHERSLATYVRNLSALYLLHVEKRPYIWSKIFIVNDHLGVVIKLSYPSSLTTWWLSMTRGLFSMITHR